MTRPLVLGPALVVVALPAACGSSAPSPAAPVGTPSATARPGAAATGAPAEDPSTGCAGTSRAVPRPAAAPADLPLPTGLVLTGSQTRSGNRLILTGLSPAPFRTVLAEVQRTFPAAGLRPEEGEVEPDDAESNFRGPRYDGRWTLKAVDGCPGGDTLVTVLVAPH